MLPFSSEILSSCLLSKNTKIKIILPFLSAGQSVEKNIWAEEEVKGG
jgi:hypothetical protein